MIGLIVGALFLALLVRFIVRRVYSPNRPIITCFLDTILDIPAALRIGPWAEKPNIQTCIKMAINTTGLTDFGTDDMRFIDRYDVTKRVGMERSKTSYSPAGHHIIQQSVSQRFAYRLRLVDYFKKHPEISKIKVKPPVFVIGFPRTGTTFLHEMLGLHPGVRSHYTWEQLAPIPKTDDHSIEAQEADRKQRYAKNQIVFNIAFKQLVNDNIQQIHRIAYDEPEECTIPCASELPWAMTEIPFMVFAADEVLPMGAGNAFKMYRQYLQLLTWQSADRRDQDFTWMLKSPFHLPYLEELFNEFPGATVVWTHRDPAECIASCCSLYETIMEMGLEEWTIQPKLIGQAVVNYSVKSLQKAEETLNKIKERKDVHMVHVRYSETVKHPKETCRKVFEAVSSFARSSFCFLSLLS
jgi:hypothetical protein